ncbi:MAG: CBS domain-containing protein [Planctomycetota bacterium]
MRVQQVMSRAVRVCRPADGLDVPARMMKDHDCGCVVVVDEEEKPLAMVTDRDVCLCAVRTLRPLQMLQVSDAMSSGIHVCRAADSLADAEGTMALRRVRRLPVIEPTGRLVGILSLDDIARETSGDPIAVGRIAKTLAQVSRPRVASRARGRQARPSE